MWVSPSGPKSQWSSKSVFSFGRRGALGFRISYTGSATSFFPLLQEVWLRALGPFLSDIWFAWSVFLGQLLEPLSTLKRMFHLSQVWWRGSEHTTPKYATLAYRLFWTECTGERGDAGKALCSPPMVTKSRSWNFPWDTSSLYQEWKNTVIIAILLSPDSGSTSKQICTSRPK